MPLSAENRAIASAARDLARRRHELKVAGKLERLSDDEEFAQQLPEAIQEIERLYRQRRRKDFESAENEKQARSWPLRSPKRWGQPLSLRCIRIRRCAQEILEV